MKEKFAYSSEYYRNPHVIGVDETRKVITVNFSGHRSELDFCAGAGVDNVHEAVHSSNKAAMEFLENIERFVTNDPKSLSNLIAGIVFSKQARIEYFMRNLHRFNAVMTKRLFESVLSVIVQNNILSAVHFLSKAKSYMKLPGFKRVRATANKAIHKFNNKIRR